jgi:hypothetical protein
MVVEWDERTIEPIAEKFAELRLLWEARDERGMFAVLDDIQELATDWMGEAGAGKLAAVLLRVSHD